LGVLPKVATQTRGEEAHRKQEVTAMATFVMLGKYSPTAMKGMSPDRTVEAVKLIEKCGGKVESMYVLLGDHDLLLIVDLPGNDEAMKVSVGLSKATGIGFTTAPAVNVDRFDEMIAGL
jgi:uncharacterized protein with GYD domain